MAAATGNARYVTWTAAGAALGGFLFGFDTSSMNAALPGLRTTLGLSTGVVGFVAAVALLGCALGAWLAGPVAAASGRNRVMLVAGALIAGGSLGDALASHALLLGVCRVAVGLGIGAASAVVPAYISELSPPAIRGRLGSLWQLGIVIGQLLGLLAGFSLSHWAGSEAEPLPWGGAAWRWMFVGVALLAAAYVLVVRRLPRTPHDLVRHGREDAARALLTRLGGEAPEAELRAIRQAQAGHTRGRLADLRGPRLGLLPVVWLGLLLAVFQQLVGINVVKTYSNTLWQAVGLSSSASFTVSVVTVLVSLGSTFVAIAIVDRVGRRTMLGVGALCMVLALGTLAACFSTATGAGADVSLSRAEGLTALVAMNAFAVAFGMTWGPVMWVMLGELFDGNLRTTAVAVCTAANWMTNWAVTRTFPLLAEAGLGFAYGGYTVFAALALLFVWRALPETRDRLLS